MNYQEFLKTKELKSIHAGFDVPDEWLSNRLFPFQRDIVKWAIKKGKAAILTGCGTGKTVMLLSYANAVSKHERGRVLILSPLSVVMQTKREAEKFNICEVTICRTQEDVKDGVNITNYEMIEHFNPNDFVGVILDESSILKSFTSKTQTLLTDMFCRTPYKLLCTATIAPNDYTEIGTSCEFLGIMSRTEMLATYFIHDGGETSKWRLKKAGVNKFWEWFATWAIYFNSPADLDYDTTGYDLPELRLNQIFTASEVEDYEMFVRLAETLEERREARKESMEDRTDKAAEMCNESQDQWIVWCDYNAESEMLKRKIDESVEVAGRDDPEFKANMSIEFSNGNVKVLVSKPSIYGFGSNWQNCHKMIFCGLSDSYEQFYQAVRRCWRFGQDKKVDVYIIISEKEQNVLQNIEEKQARMDEMQRQMTNLMKSVTLSEIKHTTRITTDYKPNERSMKPVWMK